jgi:hypothetical protein
MVLDGNADPVQWATGTGGSAAVLNRTQIVRFWRLSLKVVAAGMVPRRAPRSWNGRPR